MKDITTTKIIEVLNKNIDNSPINIENLDRDLSEIGVDSMQFITIIVALEEEFECEIPDEKLLISEMNTVNKIIEILQDIYSESSK